MAVNLATKYSPQLSKAYESESYLSGKLSTAYDFIGVKSLKVYTPVTSKLVDYVRNGTNRYGMPVEMQDIVQEMTMTQDKGFAITIDKGNNTEQLGIKRAGTMLRLQIKEQAAPEIEKYALNQIVRNGGQIGTIAAQPTKTSIVEEISKASEKLDDAKVPANERYLYVSPSIYSLIRLSPEFLGPEKLAIKALAKGVVGEIFGASVVKIPTSYLPANCYFLLMHKSAAINPTKLSEAKVHSDPPGISGDLLEGRYIYDAFVLGARADGIYSLVKASEQQAAPTINYESAELEFVSAGADTIKYTLDGSDPRYFTEAQTYSAAISTAGMEAGEYTVKAVAYKNGKFTSNVAEKKITVA